MSGGGILRFLQLLADSNPQLLASEAFDLVHHRLLNIGDHVIDLFPVLLQRLLKQLPGFLDAVGYFSTEPPPNVIERLAPLRRVRSSSMRAKSRASFMRAYGASLRATGQHPPKSNRRRQHGRRAAPG